MRSPTMETFRGAFAAFPVPLAMIRRADEKILYTNRHLDDLYGAAPETLWNQDMHRLFPRLKDRRRLRNTLTQEGRVQGEEVRGLRHDGSSLQLDVWQTPFVCNASVECVLTVVCNVTQHRHEAQAYQQQAAALTKLLEISERERRFISYEIHDGVLQDMTAALMHLQALRRTVSTTRRPTASSLEEPLQAVERLLREGIAEGRRLIEGTRIPELDEVGLVAAIEVLVRKVSETSGLAIQFTADDTSDRIPSSFENALFRIAQESLSNVVRHSRAKRAQVELREVNGQLELSVTDWGIGFDPESAGGGDDHLGLSGIQLRARLIGGTATVESEPEQGTTVRVRVPLPASPHQFAKL